MKKAKAISEIKDKVGIKICASLGNLGKEEFSLLKTAGLSRYHHNIETSPRFYKHIVSTHDFKERITTITAAKQVGLIIVAAVRIMRCQIDQARCKRGVLGSESFLSERK